MYTIEEFDREKTRVLRYILYKKRTEQEVRTKFQKTIEENMLDDIIEYLKEAGYIDDKEYIIKTVNNFKALKNLSIREIKYKLLAKGLRKNDVEDYIYENKEELEDYETKSAENIIYKKSTSMEKDEIKQFLLKKGYKLLISVGFTLIVMYQYYMYFLIYPDLNIESLYLPNFLKGIGHGVLYISLTIYVAKHIPFKHFFQSLCVLSFIRTSIATPLGAAILNRWMKHLQRDNWGLLSRDMDNLHEWMPDVSVIQLYNEVNTQTMLTSLKELFGWVCLLGTVFLVIVLSYRIWRDRHLAALKMLHSLPVKKRYRPSSVHRISKN